MMANGMLAGLVAITAPCAFVEPWAAAVIGAIAGVIVVESVCFVERKVKIDDPVGAISVHGVCGICGVLARRHLRQRQVRRRAGTAPQYADTAHGVTGIFYGGDGLGPARAPGHRCAHDHLHVMGGIAFAFFKIQNALIKGGIRPDGRGELEGLTSPRWACSPTRSSSSASSDTSSSASTRTAPSRA